MPPPLHISRKRKQRGFTLTELLVAASLLLVILSVVGQLTIRNGRVQQQTRRQHVALNELSNQLDRLTMLAEPRLTEALESLAPSKEAQELLPQPVLTANRLNGEAGNRIELRLTWRRTGKPAAMTLVGWMHPSVEANTTAEASSEDEADIEEPSP